MTLFLILLCLSLLFIYRCIWKPWRLRNEYTANFKKQGYRVLEDKFNPFAPEFSKYYNFMEGDGFALTKRDYPHYDVVITNVFAQIVVNVVHPDLTNEFLSKRTWSYEKDLLA